MAYEVGYFGETCCDIDWTKEIRNGRRSREYRGWRNVEGLLRPVCAVSEIVGGNSKSRPIFFYRAVHCHWVCKGRGMGTCGESRKTSSSGVSENTEDFGEMKCSLLGPCLKWPADPVEGNTGKE